MHDLLHHLTIGAVVQRWAATVYEEERHAFGDAMQAAHELFAADSRHLLDHLQRNPGPAARRRELGVLLGASLVAGAGCDWYEGGEVWARVAAHRTTSPPATQVLDRMSHGVRQLITATSSSLLVAAPGWSEAFGHTGQHLASAAQRGELTRGLRAVLAQHILFAWNRAGIPARQQALLAATAARVVFGADPTHLGEFTRGLAGPVVSARAATVHPVPAITTTAASPERLREHLVAAIARRGTFRTHQVEAAFRTVARHLFLPGVTVEQAYSPHPVITKRAADGSALSSASQPNLVAAMLEQLEVRPGMRVLEIGAATGINAALLAELVGPTGHVATIEIDDDLAASAAAALSAAGYPQVSVICGDGADGYPAGAPYDRIIVTAGAADLAPAWWAQLALGGRIVVPLVLHASGLTRCLALDRTQPDRMASTSALVCGFVPMRGALERTQHTIEVADGLTLRFDARVPVDEDALRQAFTTPGDEHWTGITIVGGQPTEHLDLWLASTGAGFARLFVAPDAREAGVATPTLRWAGATLHDGANLAYLTLRDLDDHTEELGIVVHGDHRDKMAKLALDHLRRWDADRPDQPTITAHPATTADEQLPHGYRIDKPDTRLTLSW